MSEYQDTGALTEDAVPNKKPSIIDDDLVDPTPAQMVVAAAETDQDRSDTAK